MGTCGRCMKETPCGCYSAESHLGLPYPSDHAEIVAAYATHDRRLHEVINRYRSALQEIASGTVKSAWHTAQAALKDMPNGSEYS